MNARTPGLALALLLACAPAGARAEGAPPDSGLGRFLGALSDSTDRYFGASAAPVDTAGLDSVLFDSATRPRRALTIGAMPTFGFNRVDGSTPGLVGWLGETTPQPGRSGWGRLAFSYQRANGPRADLGGVRFTDRVFLARQAVDLDLSLSRATSNLDRDEGERLLTLARAFLWGSDWTQYLRTEGFRGTVGAPGPWWRLSAGWRDEEQRPLAVTASWTLFGHDLDMPLNLPAARGRAREVSGAVAARLPRWPLRAELALQDASRRLGGDFEYRRLRAAAGLDLSLGRVASLLPQAAYGRLAGDALPQASFYLGSDGTLRSLRRDQRAGTGMAIAKLELVGVRDVLGLLGHAGTPFPLQPEAFVATGATWGPDPWRLAVRPAPADVAGFGQASDQAWPGRAAWSSEVGAGLVYHSPIFPQRAALHVDYAWPVGGHAGPGRWSVSFTRAFDLLGPEPKPVEEE